MDGDRRQEFVGIGFMRRSRNCPSGVVGVASALLPHAWARSCRSTVFPPGRTISRQS